MPTKIEFKIVNAYFEIIANLATGPEDFCELWSRYLSSVGWTEDQYFESLDREGDEKLN